MELKSSSIIGKPIKSVREAKKIGRIKDLILDAEKQKIQAILISPKTLINEAKLILWENIEKLDEKGAEVQSEQDIKKASEAPEPAATIVNKPKKLTKTQAVTESGETLGKLKDIIIDTDTGRVQAIDTQSKKGETQHALKKIIDVNEKQTIVETSAEPSPISPPPVTQKDKLKEQLQNMKKDAKQMVQTAKENIKGEKSSEVSQVELPPHTTVTTPSGNVFETITPTVLGKVKS